ncbi:MAG TPA: aminopeptidase [Thermomicrobiales bacterium]|nr:aminopeptidase [Thermomicrobiales bacterium]
MADPRLDVWAKALAGYSVEVRPGQTVAIVGSTAGEPLLRALYREVLNRGGFPVMLPSLPGLTADLLKQASDEQLEFITPIERFMREQADVSIMVLADTNTKSLSQVDPSRQTVYQRARRDLLQTYMERSATGELDWTLTLFPTDAYAQDADMATDDFTDFVLQACKLDTPDPVAAWKEQDARQETLIDWLKGKSEVHLTGPDTDLTLSVADRVWINANGKKNFPDGEVFTGPVEDSVNGQVRFSFPVVTAGREIEDIRLRFADGQVVDATAAKNEAYLHEQLDTDPGARFLGEFAFGTNFGITRFIKNILFDEKIGGTVHMALGAGYPETGSTNQSAVHWDLICDLRQGGRVEVDGEPFLVDGRYLPWHQS